MSATPTAGARGDDSRPSVAASHCRRHPDTPAEFRCDGCGALLCDGCIEHGHRLLFCRLCGERALPLAVDAPATAPALSTERRLDTPYSFQEGLAYPFRGSGRLLIGGYVGLLSTLDFLAGLSRLFALTTLGLRLLVALLLPAFLFAIVRTSAAGETELPDWPDFVQPLERLREWLWTLGILIAACLPLTALLTVSQCSTVALLTGAATPACYALLAIGLGLAAPIALFALGACGAYESGWLSFRLDLHLLAIVRSGREGVKAAGLVAALVVAGRLLSLLLRPLPLLGPVLSHAIGAYTLFTGSHLIGVVFRRQRRQLGRIYLP